MRKYVPSLSRCKHAVAGLPNNYRAYNYRDLQLQPLYRYTSSMCDPHYSPMLSDLASVNTPTITSIDTSTDTSTAKAALSLGLTFGGCGWAMSYLLGFADALQHRLSPEERQLLRLAGASGGSLASSLMACQLAEFNGDLFLQSSSAISYGKDKSESRYRPLGEEVTEYMARAAKSVSSERPGRGAFGITHDILRGGLEHFLPDNAHIICEGKIYVSVTRVGNPPHLITNMLIHSFPSRQTLINALLASSFVPIYSNYSLTTTLHRKLDNITAASSIYPVEGPLSDSPSFPPSPAPLTVVDGGLSQNNPIMCPNTFVVSPFPLIPYFMPPTDVCPIDSSPRESSDDAKTAALRKRWSLSRLLHAAAFPSEQSLW